LVRPWCLTCFHCNYCFAVRPHCFEFMHCLHKLTILWLDCSYIVFLLWLIKCIYSLCSGDIWKFWVFFIWFLVKILENSRTINIHCGTSFGGF
jgi:hypothetical protein